jgi:ABC-type antimicrobial peptide transport system permease subunit
MFARTQYLLRGLRHHRRVHAAVALGVAAATAVLCGALLVGDSVRGSLRALVLDRFGRIDEVLVVDRFLRRELAEELIASQAGSTRYQRIVPVAMLMGGTVELQKADGTRRAANVQLLGVPVEFWDLELRAWRPKAPLVGDQAILNATVAEELGARQGDRVVVRLPGANQVPADSPLGRKTDRVRALADLTVLDIVPGEGLGRFSLRSSQQTPRTVFLPLESVQRAIEQPEKVNALLAVAKPGRESTASERMAAWPIPATLTDRGLKLSRVTRVFTPPAAGSTPEGADSNEPSSKPETVLDYFQLSSDRLLLEDDVARVALEAWASEQPQPVLTYLANWITKVDGTEGAASKPAGIPYSMVSAVDATSALGPLRTEDGTPLPPLADDEIVLTSWSAEDLAAKPGDRVRLTWFEPETTHGETRETSAEFRLRAIMPLVEPVQGFRRNRPPVFAKRPSEVNDPDLTPTVEGVTDQETIDKWDPPFPYDARRMRSQDDQYWSRHRTTPKAFLSLSAGQRLWGSRFGRLTSIRVPAREGLELTDLERRLSAALSERGVRQGLEFLPLKVRSLEAARGATPFDALFLSLSFFVIGAALLLVALLFRLGLEQRAAEIGLLLAMGWPVRRVGRTLAMEAAAVAAIGGLLGVFAGMGYAWLMLAGLRTWWLGAITTPFLNLHITPRSLIVGYASGVVVSVLVTLVSLRSLRRVPIRPLLAGQMAAAVAETASTSRSPRSAKRGRERWVMAGLAATGVAASAAASALSAEAQAGAFVAGGGCFLAVMLMAVWRWFRGESGRERALASTLPSLAARNAGRNASRSTLTIGLVASACFLIVAMSAFRQQPTEGGVGGFSLMAESAQPVFVDLNSPTVRTDLWGGKSGELEGAQIFAWRVQPGDDASCNNLYQATQPRVLGVSRVFIDDADGANEPDAADAADAAKNVGTADKVQRRAEARAVAGVNEPSAGARFTWAKTAARDEAERRNPWRLLMASNLSADGSGADDVVPCVLDLNTALYSLHLYGGIGEQFAIDYAGGKRVRFQVVGLLANSVLQGTLLVDESRFTRLFPEVAGYRFFLVRVPMERAAAVANALEDRLGDEGFDATDSRQVLAGYLAVQNTYLSTFQSLGALGLVLGTFGLATVQVRGVIERRGELALLRAAGFSRARLARMVMCEHAVLLLGGLVLGTLAALAAVIPHGALGNAQAPWGELSGWLAIVLLVGLASGWLALRAMARAPLIAALRGD